MDAESKSTLQMVKHQFQPTEYSCVHTCMAMMLDIPAMQIIEAIDEAFPYLKGGGLGYFDSLIVLRRLALEFLPTSIPRLWQGWQMVQVPSLNYEAGSHCILIHYDMPSASMAILDPSNQKQYDPTGKNLKSWSNNILLQKM